MELKTGQKWQNKGKGSNSSRFGADNPCFPCRRCCQGPIIKVSEEDIKRWKKEQRYDILLCMETWTGGIPFLIHKESEDKNEREDCIFLIENGCSIHETRPDICRKFPVSENHAKEMGCKLAELLKENAEYKG